MYGFLRFVQERCTVYIYFWDFEPIHDFVGLSQIFEVKSRLCPNLIFKLFLGCMAHSETHTLRDIVCKNVFSLNYCSYLWVCGTWHWQKHRVCKSGAPKDKFFKTYFIDFKTISFTTSYVFWICSWDIFL